MLSDDAIDRLIDDTARTMTAGVPSAAFRARVLAGFDSRRSWFVQPVTWSTAAAAAVLIAVVVWRGPERREAPVPPRESAAQLIPPATPITTTAPSIATSVPHERPARRPAATHEAAPESAVAALAPPPLWVDTIAIPAIDDANSIRIEPLDTIAPITVTPIGEPQGEHR